MSGLVIRFKWLEAVADPRRRAVFAAAAFCSFVLGLSPGLAENVGEPATLKGILPPASDETEYIQDLESAQQLGKALFWDTQAGNDGVACASCHFHAGSDIRTQKQLNPGRQTDGPPGRLNRQLIASDFPLHKLADPNDRESAVIRDANIIVGSISGFAGGSISSPSFRNDFAEADCPLGYASANPSGGGSPFHAGGLIYRMVEPRHAPSTINAAFYTRQFWDGRANSEFNGVDPFGRRTFSAMFTDGSERYGNPQQAGLGILVSSSSAARGAPVSLVHPLIKNASLASQAVAGPLSSYDIVCGGKSFADIGRQLLPMQVLSTQMVDINDSLFGKTPGLVNRIRLPGLNATYQALVQRAFNPKYWAAPGRFLVDPKGATVGPVPNGAAGYLQIEYNFSLFWGLAIQAYERLLISDESAYDRGIAALTPEAVRGKSVFMGKGKCVSCHSGPLFSNAAKVVAASAPMDQVEGTLLSDGKSALFDRGFYNTGVRPSSEDLGLGATDPYGFALSLSRQYKWRLLGKERLAPDDPAVEPCSFEAPLFRPCQQPPQFASPNAAPRDAVDGAFKVPTLRNVGLSPPYFHNGGQASLKDVVRFYNRGGDRRGQPDDDSTGLTAPTPFGSENKSNLPSAIGDADNTSRHNSLGLSEREMNDLVQFLLSLTDPRVACHAGNFDHPSLPLIVGQEDIGIAGSKRARDIVRTLPAAGKRGLENCFPNSGDLFDSNAVLMQIAK